MDLPEVNPAEAPRTPEALLGGMLLVVLLAFGHPANSLRDHRLRRNAGGAIHIVSVGTAVAAGWLCAAVLAPPWLAYLSAGAAAGFVYQIVLAVEMVATLIPDDDERSLGGPTGAGRSRAGR